MTTKIDSTDKLYNIRDWDGNFENNRTRKMKHMMWVPVPNKHDGDGYTELVDREDGAEMLGAWLAILQVASKCAERGTLVRDNGTPHTPKTIARQTRLKEGVICKALGLLCSPDIGWLQVVDVATVAPKCANGAPSAHPTDEEEKGIEEKGIEGNTYVADAPENKLCRSFVLKIGANYNLDEWVVERWKETYSCDVEFELKCAADWLINNPTKRKTTTGMNRFLGSWLQRASKSFGNSSSDEIVSTLK